MKVTTLLTALDYSVQRANSVNGVPIGNFLKDCQYDNTLKLTEEYCRDAQRKHMTESDALFFPDDGLAVNMWRAIATKEEIVFNIVVSQSHSNVRLRLNVKRGIPPDEFFGNAGSSPPSTQWESESAQDYAKIVDWAKLNFGDSKVTFAPARKELSK